MRRGGLLHMCTHVRRLKQVSYCAPSALPNPLLGMVRMSPGFCTLLLQLPSHWHAPKQAKAFSWACSLQRVAECPAPLEPPAPRALLPQPVCGAWEGLALPRGSAPVLAGGRLASDRLELPPYLMDSACV